MLSKKQRLPIQFFVGKRGKLAKGSYFLVKIYDTKEFSSRFGVTVSAKVSKKAVERNRLKRMAYNFIQEYYKKIPVGDYWISVLPPAAKLEKENFQKELKKILDSSY